MKQITNIITFCAVSLTWHACAMEYKIPISKYDPLDYVLTDHYFKEPISPKIISVTNIYTTPTTPQKQNFKYIEEAKEGKLFYCPNQGCDKFFNDEDKCSRHQYYTCLHSLEKTYYGCVACGKSFHQYRYNIHIHDEKHQKNATLCRDETMFVTLTYAESLTWRKKPESVAKKRKI